MSAAVTAADTTPGAWSLLRQRAELVMARAYAPYSGFKVGAALLAADGTVVDGCNVENAAYPAGICAERVAVGAAVARGLRDFTALVIVTDAETPTPPCGMCRQVLVELAPDLVVLSVTRGGAESRWSTTELMPHAFTPKSLGRR